MRCAVERIVEWEQSTIFDTHKHTLDTSKWKRETLQTHNLNKDVCCLVAAAPLINPPLPSSTQHPPSTPC